MSFKMVFLPPQSDTTRGWADRLNRDIISRVRGIGVETAYDGMVIKL